MAVTYFNNQTPAANTVATLIPTSALYDYFTSVVCVNKGLGDARVTVYAESAGDVEGAKMYYCSGQVVSGNSTFETKKLTITGTKALKVLSDNGNVVFSSVGLRTDRV
jgi:hypothetical protein